MKFSIITPSFNQADFIEETIRSVIYQAGCFDLEYIIMGGGSPDGSVEIIKHYSSFIAGPHFKPRCNNLSFTWRSEKDSGQSKAINKGFTKATGDIINWLCSDDLLAPGALQTYTDFFARNPNTHAVTANSYRINQTGTRVYSLSNKPVSRQWWGLRAPYYTTAFWAYCVPRKIDVLSAWPKARSLLYAACIRKAKSLFFFIRASGQ
jgi:glycosyltransferase involved in cell wall biosynthesis